MASPQFLHLLEHLHKSHERRPLPWQPVRQWPESSRCDLRIALGVGIVSLACDDDDEHTLHACYTARLTTRDGLLVDEVVAHQLEKDYYPLISEIYQQARAAAFDLSRLVDGMLDDLETGKAPDLPEDNFNESDIPF
ncbi:MAG: hypothetical protein ACREEM_44505 [Blastocatellia bacterium]